MLRTAKTGVTLKHLVQVSKAVGHPARLRILSMLKGRKLCVCQMTSVLRLAYPTVSGHLSELKRAGLLLEDKQGKWVFYSLDPGSPFAQMIDDMLVLVTRDEGIAYDRELIDQVRAVPIALLTGAGLNLKKVGIRLK